MHGAFLLLLLIKGVIVELSNYNNFVTGYPSKDDVLVFNTRTEAFFKINDKLYRALQNLSSYGCSEPEYLQYKDALYENGVIVESLEDDYSKVDDFFVQLERGDEKEFNAMLLTTYACNLGCIYCYQSPLNEKSFMTKETAEAAVKWLVNQVLVDGYKTLRITFYGGEPLMNKDIMFYVAEQLHIQCKENKIELLIGLISNGTLLNDDIIKKMLKYNLVELRVSIDGKGKYHDQRRPFKNGDPSFEVIMKNLISVSKLIKPVLIGTYSEETLPGVYELIDYIDEVGMHDRIEQISFVPLVPRLGSRDNPGSVELSDCSKHVEANGLAMKVLEINKYIASKGMPIRVCMDINICPMIMKNQGAIIDPYGDIFSCATFLGRDEYRIAKVTQFGYNEKPSEYRQIHAWEKCPKDCKYLPMCQGGCRFSAFIENDDIKSMCCKKNYNDAMLPELMKFQYDCLAAQA